MVDLLFFALLLGSGVLGWLRGVAVSLAAAGAMLVTGTPVAAVVVALGSPLPVLVAFLLGGTVGLFLVALRSDRIQEFVEAHLPAAARIVDRALGASANVVTVVAIGWFVAAVATVIPGSSGTMEAVRSSAVLGSFVEEVPPAGALGAVVLRSGLVPGLNGPLVIAEPPDPAVVDLAPVRAATNSVVQVRGVACGKLVTGTAWVAAPGLLLTNAHVVSGQTKTFISGGPRFGGVQADVVAMDRALDVAVLALRSTGLPPVLQLRNEVRHGESAAVIGYPKGGEERVDAARVDRIANFESQPVGGGEPVLVPVLALRGRVEPGNSGGPIVDGTGQVIGLVVARGVGQRVPTIYGVASAQLGTILTEGSRRVPVDTGRCLTDADLQTEVAARR